MDYFNSTDTFFDVYTIILKVVLILFCLNSFIYIYFIYQSFKVIILIVWLIFGVIMCNREVSKYILIALKRRFQSVHHHNKICTNNILFPLFHLFLFKISIVQKNKLHCLKFLITIMTSDFIESEQDIYTLVLLIFIKLFWSNLIIHISITIVLIQDFWYHNFQEN